MKEALPMAMELPDEAITYNYQKLLVPVEEWTAAAEIRSRHFVPPGRLKEPLQEFS